MTKLRGNEPSRPAAYSDLTDRLMSVRQQTETLAWGLSDADATAQSMPDASPAKWHLAHTTWFFEQFIVVPALGEAARYDQRYGFLFNSYYDAVGERHARHQRGLLTRPSLDEVLAWREHVNGRLVQIAHSMTVEQHDLIQLGIAHEEQHQELMATDILHLFAQNPLRPAFRSPEPLVSRPIQTGCDQWMRFDGGVHDIGSANEEFGFDCEKPRHRVMLAPFEIAYRAVTNAQWMAFIESGGYESPEHWLSDGIDIVRSSEWVAPLYWFEHEGAWHTMTLRGPQLIDEDAPVCHISHYEAALMPVGWGPACPPSSNGSMRQNIHPRSQTLSNRDDCARLSNQLMPKLYKACLAISGSGHQVPSCPTRAISVTGGQLANTTGNS